MDTIRPKGQFTKIMQDASGAENALEAYNFIMLFYGIHPTLVDAANNALGKVPDGTAKHFLDQFIHERDILLRA